jgi:hypothetical protein
LKRNWERLCANDEARDWNSGSRISGRFVVKRTRVPVEARGAESERVKRQFVFVCSPSAE